MAVLTAAFMLTAVAGFLACKEYDRSIKRINYNRKLRRERAEEMRREEERKRIADEERRKNRFIYGVEWGAPR